MTQDLLAARTATTEFPVIDAIRNRWSPRSYSDQPIPQVDLNTLFEAASWAPSAINEQPWQYIYAHRENEEAFQKLADCLLPGNQVWAKNASVLVLSVARKTFSATGKPNPNHLYDTGAANMALLLQAAEMGILGHVMGGFDRQKATEAFNLPDDVEPVVMIALGYRDSHEKLDEPFRTRETAPRTRKPLAEFTQEA